MLTWLCVKATPKKDQLFWLGDNQQQTKTTSTKNDMDVEPKIGVFIPQNG